MAATKDDQKKLTRIFFIPYCSAGHVIPMLDTAILFTRHGVDTTIVTTPANARLFQNSIDRESSLGHPIWAHILPFPTAEAGLFAGVESASTLEEFGKVFKAFMVLLRGPMERLLHEARPDCIISDPFFTWSGALAAELGVPRLVFHSSSFAGHCGELSTVRGQYDVVARGAEEVLSLRRVPHKMEMLRSKMPDWIKCLRVVTAFLGSVHDYGKTSDGAIVNSFTELERGYEEWFMRTHQGLERWTNSAACGRQRL